MRKDALDGRVVAEIGISMAVERLLREGYHVAMPIIDDGYDLIAFSGRRAWRIQVKATSSDGANRSRISVRRGRKKQTRYTAKEVDAFILVHTGTRTVLCVPVSEARGPYVCFSTAKRYSDFGILRTLKN